MNKEFASEFKNLLTKEKIDSRIKFKKNSIHKKYLKNYEEISNIQEKTNNLYKEKKQLMDIPTIIKNTLIKYMLIFIITNILWVTLNIYAEIGLTKTLLFIFVTSSFITIKFIIKTEKLLKLIKNKTIAEIDEKIKNLSLEKEKYELKNENLSKKYMFYILKQKKV